MNEAESFDPSAFKKILHLTYILAVAVKVGDKHNGIQSRSYY